VPKIIEIKWHSTKFLQKQKGCSFFWDTLYTNESAANYLILVSRTGGLDGSWLLPQWFRQGGEKLSKVKVWQGRTQEFEKGGSATFPSLPSLPLPSFSLPSPRAVFMKFQQGGWTFALLSLPLPYLRGRPPPCVTSVVTFSHATCVRCDTEHAVGRAFSLPKPQWFRQGGEKPTKS